MRKFFIAVMCFFMIFLSGCSVGAGLENDGAVIVPAKTAAGETTQAKQTAAATYKETSQVRTTESNETTRACENTTAAHKDTTTVPPDSSSAVDTHTDKEGHTNDQIVFWVEGGSVWHTDKSCSSLLRSKNILSGTIDQAMKAGKSRACKICSK